MGFVSIDVFKTSNATEGRMVVLASDDVVVFSGPKRTSLVQLRLTSTGVALPPFVESSESAQDRREWRIEVPAAQLVKPWGAKEWLIETELSSGEDAPKLGPAGSEAVVDAYRETPSAPTWQACGTLRVVHTARRRWTLVGAGLGAIVATWVAVLALVSPVALPVPAKWFVGEACIIGLYVAFSVLVFRHSIRWWMRSLALVLPPVWLSVALVLIFQRVAVTVEVKGSTPLSEQHFGPVGTRRLLFALDGDQLMMQLAAEGGVFSSHSESTRCEGGASRMIPGIRSAIFTCSHRWLYLEPHFLDELGVPEFARPRVRGCIDVTGPRCVPSGSTSEHPPGAPAGSLPIARPEQRASHLAATEWNPAVSGHVHFRSTALQVRPSDVSTYRVHVWGGSGVTHVVSEFPQFSFDWDIAAPPTEATHTEFSLRVLNTQGTQEFSFYLTDGPPVLAHCANSASTEILLMPIDPTLVASVGLEGQPSVYPSSGQRMVALCYPHSGRAGELTVRVRRERLSTLCMPSAGESPLGDIVVPPGVWQVALVNTVPTGHGAPTEPNRQVARCESRSEVMQRLWMTALDSVELSSITPVPEDAILRPRFGAFAAPRSPTGQPQCSLLCEPRHDGTLGTDIEPSRPSDGWRSINPPRVTPPRSAP